MILDRIFEYATLAHGALASGYLTKIKDKNREKMLYLLAHIFITITMLIRIDQTNVGTIVPSILGTVGHSLLLVFFLLTTFVFHKKYRVSFSSDMYFLNIFCILAQIGMIIIYWVEYFKHQNENKDLENEEFFKNLKTITFATLSIFYTAMAFKSDNKYSMIFVGLLLVSILYIVFLYENLR